MLALAIVEVGLRLTGSAPLHRHALASFHDGHPRIGWIGSPGFEARFLRAEFDVRIASGPDGFRRPDPNVDGGDRPVAAFLGDSFTWGWGVDQGEVFTDVLRGLLDDRWSVKNYGVNAFGTTQELVLLREIVLPTRPRRVTVLFFANDPEECIDSRGGRRPWARLAGDRIAIENLPPERETASLVRRLSRRSLALSSVRYGANALGDLARRVEASAAPIAVGEKWREVPEGWSVCSALLREMADTCAAADPPVEFRLVYVPTAHDVVHHGGEGPSALHAAVVEACAADGIELLDLTADFARAWRDHPDRGDLASPYYFRIDGHWTPEGHALAARRIAESFGE